MSPWPAGFPVTKSEMKVHQANAREMVFLDFVMDTDEAYTVMLLNGAISAHMHARLLSKEARQACYGIGLAQ